MNHNKTWTILSAVCLLSLIFCAPRETPKAAEDPQQAFWNSLQKHCGAAFAGHRTVARPANEMLAGDEPLIAHFRECSELNVKIPFHIGPSETTPAPAAPPDGWDRSRTWVFTRHDGRLEIRHDHRKPDGSEDENTWYGGFTETPGTAHLQEFIYHDRKDPDGLRLGWRIEIHPGDRFVYGTIRGDDWTWRIEFDLSREIDAPPAPWGHERP
jgi:hypothetical protein